MKHFILGIALTLATPALAQQTLEQRVAAKLAEAPTGTRFGLVVADDTGREIVAINPDGRFIPASNTKIYTTAAAFANLPGINAPDATGGAAVRLVGEDVVLEGRGDARLSSADDCTVDCLATLADAIAAKTKRVRNVIGDDTLFPDQRWGPGMSWNNIPSSSGTGASALTLDDNELKLTVAPAKAGEAARVELWPYFTIDNQAKTVPGGETELGWDRDPNGKRLRITGTIGADAGPKSWKLGIDDPADYAAWRLKALLEARGVQVKGTVSARHRPLRPEDDPEYRAKKGVALARATPDGNVLARLTPPPLAEDFKHINKVSQNLHAELALRRVAFLQGSGSIADGVAQVAKLLDTAGLPRTAWDFSDGSGMSSYNRVSPRGSVKLLRWVAAQPWGAQFRDTLPIGGVDGTLARRFKGTPLEGKVFAKTGTLNATNALAGYFTGASGRTYTFAFYANDVPQDASATKYMDDALNLVAAGN
ncbi:D-alanyl-D-alanine carboxypeptidase/D-alanyl-D-alanine-endopeptidase (penicillin-binding protein 4) [Sphingomonas leidyi]|uniref:D-alanyl-D-alanine carboxypeptidase/D-alanyl-D-alanine-endopeptidase (Penicillin-binding protein 4) n=4 Tax=Pseudomonadota TaxID=1224 RepID=A0A7X5V5C8_9SPHN|nr:D-alanyl-D-alanine carboxypeptidase/D-alanyl-D-alanine-endopeptidase [Sphingomonas leidyi]NIJ67532.1 D-alanyl-D-alanine carboxypeptidase/D-alanyl-D-alanine-endopeptidase (penicillin-binding protein 4) [Sphingomonas leidyi]